jgi:hypothetical protein
MIFGENQRQLGPVSAFLVRISGGVNSNQKGSGSGKTQNAVILSEAKNDRISHCFRSLSSLFTERGSTYRERKRKREE